jgi:hypothetical protein
MSSGALEVFAPTRQTPTAFSYTIVVPNAADCCAMRSMIVRPVGASPLSTPFTMLKIAVVAPTPSASVTTAPVAKPGCFRDVRAA